MTPALTAIAYCPRCFRVYEVAVVAGTTCVRQHLGVRWRADAPKLLAVPAEVAEAAWSSYRMAGSEAAGQVVAAHLVPGMLEGARRPRGQA